jgi:hypothetical protein
MKKTLLGLVVGAFVAVSAWSSPASAGLIYDLNCVIPDGCVSETVVASYGTVTVEDNAGDPTKIDVTINLVGTNQLVHKVFLNYDDAQFENNAFEFTGDVATGDVDENDQMADGYPGGLDIQVPDTGNFDGDPEPYTFTIFLPAVDLDPSDFDFLDSLDHIFLAVHIGACGPEEPDICLPGQTGDNSIWVGSLSQISVTEPGTLSLFVAGLAGLGWILRRRRVL